MPQTNRYDNSRPFDVHKWSDYPQLLEATKRLYSELFTQSNEKRKKNLRVVLLDLYKCYLEDSEKYIGFHRSNGSYKNDRYNALHIGIKPLKAVIDALDEAKYIEVIDGFFDRRSGGASRISRMRALPKLIELIERCTEDDLDIPVPPHVIYRHPDEELIILKDENKTPIEYEDTEEITRIREELRKYNELLERTFIDIDLVEYVTPEEEILRIDTTNKRVRRIFNNGSFEDGGRFYGGWWQNVKKELRRRIMMGETAKPTFEVDYKAIHINLLYHLVGKNYFEGYKEELDEDYDPYTIDNSSDEESKEKWRNFYKLVLLVCLNSKNEVGAVRAVMSELKAGGDNMSYPTISNYAQIKKAINIFETKHKPIKQFFYSGIGIKLQHIDSMIAEKVIRHFVAEHIPVLCIHDSFICTTRDSQHLERIIESAMKDTIKELEDDWGSCSITPVSKSRDGWWLDEIRNRNSGDNVSPFNGISLEELSDKLYANGSYEPRLNIWKEYKYQTIINYQYNQ